MITYSYDIVTGQRFYFDPLQDRASVRARRVKRLNKVDSEVVRDNKPNMFIRFLALFSIY